MKGNTIHSRGPCPGEIIGKRIFIIFNSPPHPPHSMLILVSCRGPLRFLFFTLVGVNIELRGARGDITQTDHLTEFASFPIISPGDGLSSYYFFHLGLDVLHTCNYKIRSKQDTCYVWPISRNHPHMHSKSRPKRDTCIQMPAGPTSHNHVSLCSRAPLTTW